MERPRKRILPYLAPEVWNQVLARLPVKSLLRFRCVCKNWCSLIDDPNFVSFHLSQFKNNSENTHMLFSEYLNRKPRWVIRRGDTLAEADVLSGFPFGLYEVRGCVNGVMMLINRPFHPNSVVLLNLSIRKYVKIPSCQMLCRRPGARQVGLVFDHSGNDYKVVAISDPAPNEPGFAEVYSLNAGCWKRVAGATPVVWYRGYPLFFNGSVHWIGEESHHLGGKSYVVSFNAAEEVFNSVTLPGFRGVRSALLTTVGGCLALLAPFMDHSDLWVMEEYGVVNSWNKRYTINATLPMYFSIFVKRNGELLFASDKGGAKSYDTGTELLKDAVETYAVLKNYVDIYVESLALHSEGLLLDGYGSFFDYAVSSAWAPRPSCRVLALWVCLSRTFTIRILLMEKYGAVAVA
ncbi:hypothetical protein Dimus_011956 [Dionaea muscipula]